MLFTMKALNRTFVVLVLLSVQTLFTPHSILKFTLFYHMLSCNQQMTYMLENYIPFSFFFSKLFYYKYTVRKSFFFLKPHCSFPSTNSLIVFSTEIFFSTQFIWHI